MKKQEIKSNLQTNIKIKYLRQSNKLSQFRQNSERYTVCFKSIPCDINTQNKAKLLNYKVIGLFEGESSRKFVTVPEILILAQHGLNGFNYFDSTKFNIGLYAKKNIFLHSNEVIRKTSETT
jgi:hypothetical protein